MSSRYAVGVRKISNVRTTIRLHAHLDRVVITQVPPGIHDSSTRWISLRQNRHPSARSANAADRMAFIKKCLISPYPERRISVIWCWGGRDFHYEVARARGADFSQD
jgi:hypothetical protein